MLLSSKRTASVTAVSMRATGTPQAAGDCLRMTIVSPRTTRPELMLFDLMELDGKSLAALPLC
jgi:hypothetical protein